MEGDAEAELIAAGVGGGALVLLGRHIGGRAGDLGDALGAGAGEAEVGDARDAVLAEEDVVGFEVAVDHAGAVSRGEALTGGDEAGEHGLPRGSVLAEPGAERATLDVLHGDEGVALVLAELVDLDDVGV